MASSGSTSTRKPRVPILIPSIGRGSFILAIFRRTVPSPPTLIMSSTPSSLILSTGIPSIPSTSAVGVATKIWTFELKWARIFLTISITSGLSQREEIPIFFNRQFILLRVILKVFRAQVHWMRPFQPWL